jgi:hypothetical protein
MNEATKHRLAGYLRITLALVGVVAIGLGYGLWWAAQMLLGNGCEASWVTPASACQQTLVALQNQYLASLIAGVAALACAGVMYYLHRRALRGETA